MSKLQKITLAIVTPGNGAVLAGRGSVTSIDVDFNGAVNSNTHELSPLYFTWYSSLQELGTGLSFGPTALSVGSHVITLMAKDQNDSGVAPADLKNLYQSVLHIGSAGGPSPQEGDPCVIHVLVSNMLVPGATDTQLSKTNPRLSAEAPSLWANYIDHGEDPPTYEGMNADYHAVNRVCYRWDIRRQEETVGTAIPIGEADNADLVFVAAQAEGEKNLLRYEGSLPAPVVIGDTYTIRLRVFDKDNEDNVHTIERTLEIT